VSIPVLLIIWDLDVWKTKANWSGFFSNL